jgi:hypothetical protein
MLSIAWLPPKMSEAMPARLFNPSRAPTCAAPCSRRVTHTGLALASGIDGAV